MQRRKFLASTVATLCLPRLAMAGDSIEYAPGVIENALAEGKTIFVDYYASWCSTCRAQENRIAELRAANPAYNEAMMFVKVDWDQYSDHPVATSRNIPRRSTLIVLKGDQELGRIVAQTGQAVIEELMQVGLAAASS